MSEHTAMSARRSLLVCIASVLAAVTLHGVTAIWAMIGVDAGWTFSSPYSTTSSIPLGFRVYQLVDMAASAAWCIGALAGVRNLWLLNTHSRGASPTTCRHCGYDSTSVNAPACPECGQSDHRSLRPLDPGKSA